MKQDIDPKEKLKQILVGYIRFGLTYQSHYEIMFLIKDENVRYFINEGPSKSYEKFANSVDSLCEKKLSIQEIWSIFLSLHGFVVHYLGHVTSYDDVKDLVNAHANFLLRIID